MIGGGERYAEALAAQVTDQGHKVTVLTSSASQQDHLWLGSDASDESTHARRDSAGARIIRCPIQRFFLGRNGLFAWRKAMIMLSSLPGNHTRRLEGMARHVPGIHWGDALNALGPIDLVHAFNISWEYPMVLAARLAARRCVPLVITPFAHLGTGPRDRVALNNTMQHQLAMLREADAVLALTSVEQDGLARRGVRKERMHILPAGIDDWAPAEAMQAEAPVTWPRPYVCFVGRNSQDKGAIQTLQAVIRLRQRGIGVDLVMVGQRDATFQRQLGGLSASEQRHIHVLGLVDETTKQRAIAGSAMLALPSRVDSFGIVFLEAWRHGKPVIGANAGGIPGVIREGIDGLLVEHGDTAQLAAAMERLLADPQLASELGASGEARLRDEFDWGRLGERLISLYASLTERNTPSQREA